MISKMVNGELLWLDDDEALVDWGDDYEPTHVARDSNNPSVYWFEMPHKPKDTTT